MLRAVHSSQLDGVLRSPRRNAHVDNEWCLSLTALQRGPNHRNQLLLRKWQWIGLHTAGFRCLLSYARQISFGNSPCAERWDVEFGGECSYPLDAILCACVIPAGEYTRDGRDAFARWLL